MVLMSWGARIKALVDERGLSDTELGQRIDYSRQGIGHWWRRANPPKMKPETMVQLADILGIHAIELLPEEWQKSDAARRVFGPIENEAAKTLDPKELDAKLAAADEFTTATLREIGIMRRIIRESEKGGS